MLIKPYSDDYMTYDEAQNRYVLTEKAVLDEYGIDLSAEALDSGNLIAVKSILRRVSKNVYNFIHGFSCQNETQDLMIARSESGRQMIQAALLEQFLYMRVNGDLSLSSNRDERMNAVSDDVREILERRLPEYCGYSVLYSGALPFRIEKDE